MTTPQDWAQEIENLNKEIERLTAKRRQLQDKQQSELDDFAFHKKVRRILDHAKKHPNIDLDADYRWPTRHRSIHYKYE